MKTKTLLALALCVGLYTASAQTTDTNLPPMTTVTEAFSLGSLSGLGKTIAEQVKGISFKEGFTVSPFGLYHKGDLGGGVSLHTANTNGLRVGLALAAVNEHDVHGGGIFNKGASHWDFIDATINIGANGTFTVPLINMTVDLFVESGPAFNARNISEVYEQSVAGASKTFLLSKNSRTAINIYGGIGHISKPGWNDGPFYLFGIGGTF